MLAGLGAAFIVLAAAFSAWLLLGRITDVLNPPDRTAPQRVPFTGGQPPAVHAWSRFHARYYAMALLFLAFDMEMVFMYPWAVVFMREGFVAFVEMLMFITILVLGILYAWRERALDWS